MTTSKPRSNRCGVSTAPAADVLVAAGVAAATDITGFGLLGHALEMARGSGTRFVFDADALPYLAGALALARDGIETGGASHNRRFVANFLTVGPGVAQEVVALAHDPQTSGGLLAAIPADDVARVDAALDDAGVEHWWIGEVTDTGDSENRGAVELR